MNLKPALYIVIAMIIAVIFFGGRFNLTPTPSDSPSATTAPTTTLNTTTETTPASPLPSSPTISTPQEGVHQDDAPPVSTPSHDGGEDPDWEIPGDIRQGSISITQQFITAWLEPDPETRQQLLAPVAAQALIEELAVDNLKTWNTTPASAPLIVEITSTDAMTRQTFTDGRSVDLLLAAEPGTPHGWIITDIQPTNQ